MYNILLQLTAVDEGYIHLPKRTSGTWSWIGRMPTARDAMKFARRNCRKGRVRVRKIRH